MPELVLNGVRIVGFHARKGSKIQYSHPYVIKNQARLCRGLWMPELVLRLLAKQLLETVHDLSSLESSCCRQRPLTPPPGECSNDNGNITPIFVEFHICRDFDNVKMLYCCIVLYNIIKTDPLLSFFQPKQQIILKDLRY